MSGSGRAAQQPQERRRGCGSPHVAAITGCSALEMHRSPSPPCPAPGCLSPPGAKVPPAAPCWESIQLEKGRACPAAAGVTGMGSRAFHCLKNATFFFFSRGESLESWRSFYSGMALPPSVPSAVQQQQPSLPGQGGSWGQALLLFPIAALAPCQLSGAFPHVKTGLARAHRPCPEPRAFQGPPMPAGGLEGQEGHVGLAPMGFGASPSPGARSHLQR